MDGRTVEGKDVTFIVKFRHDVKEKRVCVVIKRFMVEKQFGQKAQILRVVFVFSAVDFEKGDRAFAIDFVARRMTQQTFGRMSLETSQRFRVFETKFAEINAL